MTAIMLFLYNIIILPSSANRKSPFETIIFNYIYIYILYIPTTAGRYVFSFFCAFSSLNLFISFSFCRFHINRESAERVDIIIVINLQHLINV